MKKYIRTIKVNNKTYKWIVDKNQVRIYDDTKKMFRFKHTEIDKGDYYEDVNYNTYYNNYESITPKMIRLHIISNKI